jgi:hypothetical protein
MSYQGHAQQPFTAWDSDHLQQLQEQATQAQLIAAWPTPSPSPGQQFPQLATPYNEQYDPFAPGYLQQCSYQADMWMTTGQQSPSSQVLRHGQHHPSYALTIPQQPVPLLRRQVTATHASGSNVIGTLNMQQAQGSQCLADPALKNRQVRHTYQRQVDLVSSPGGTQQTQQSTPKMSSSGLRTPPWHPIHPMSNVTPPTATHQRKPSVHTRMLMTPDSSNRTRVSSSNTTPGSTENSPIIISSSSATGLHTPAGSTQGMSASTEMATTQPTRPTNQQQASHQTEAQLQEQQKAGTVLERRKSYQKQRQATANMAHCKEDQVKAAAEVRRQSSELTRKRATENHRRAQRQSIELNHQKQDAKAKQQQQVIEFERQQQAFEIQRQHQISAAKEKQRLALEQQAANEEKQRLEKEQQILFNELVEQERVVQEQKLERERRFLRKEQLRKDPSALYRHYDEYLEYFPLAKDEYRSQYHNNLLANRRMPSDPDNELGLAIRYAKDNWELFLLHPRSEPDAIGWQKVKLANIAADKEKDNKR